TYALDSLPSTESFNVDNRDYTMSRTYDAGNRPISHTFADNNQKFWSYDERNLVTQVMYEDELIVNQTHDAGYRLLTQEFGNDLERTITYARADNLRTTDKVMDGSTTLNSLHLTYTYNEDKQVTSETTSGGFLDNSSFSATYDAGDRLKTWTRPDAVTLGTRETEAWTYDDAGNQISVTRDSTTEARTHNSDNELTAIAGDSTTLDAKGNMTEDAEGNQYLYDLDNRIYEIDMDGGDTIELAYDALGRRVFRKNGSDEQTYLWWGDQEIAEHKSISGQATIQNDIWAHPTALNQIIARAVEGSKHDLEFYHKNYLDHVYAVTDEDGDIIELYRYTAFGEPEIYTPTGTKLATSAIDNPVLWNSRRYDADTELYYYKYRQYKSDIGRWLSRDPIEEWGGSKPLCICE
ncbi:hypothetical protein OAB00_04505, partial [Akkermansiaceae bacterium]|nr:hypothetical protein [Akkermansiaceae bacterium]